MKTINITSVEIEEISLRPLEETMSICYRLKDDAGVVAFRKREVLHKSDLSATALTALGSLLSKVVAKIETQEGIV